MGAMNRQSLLGEFLLFRGKPACGFRIIWQKKPDEECGKTRWNPLKKEKPSPRRKAARLIHMANAIGDGTSKGSC
jgi:hypothetical protein